MPLPWALPYTYITHKVMNKLHKVIIWRRRAWMGLLLFGNLFTFVSLFHLQLPDVIHHMSLCESLHLSLGESLHLSLGESLLNYRWAARQQFPVWLYSPAFSFTGEFSPKFWPEKNDFDLHIGYFVKKMTQIRQISKNFFSKSPDFNDKF
jgi:hypothetical protein